jgi:hypothetical protein
LPVSEAGRQAISRRAWVGTVDDLRRVCDVLDRPLDELREQLLRASEAQLQDELNRAGDLDPIVDSVLIEGLERRSEVIESLVRERQATKEALARRDAESRRARIARSYRLQLTAERYERSFIPARRSRPRRSAVGPAHEVLAQLDPKVFNAVHIDVVDAADVTCFVGFDEDDGVHGEILGEYRWALGLSAALDEEIRRGVPPWSWLRDKAMNWVFAILGAAGGAALGHRYELTELGSLAGASLGTLMFFVVRELMPGFELTAPGQAGRGARAVALAAAFVLGVAASLVAGLLS